MKERKPKRPVASTLSLILAVTWLAAIVSAPLSAAPPQRLSDSLDRMASAGEFDSLLKSLKTDRFDGKDPAVAGLIEQLERFGSFGDKREEKRKADFDKAMETMRKHVKDGKLDDALIAAVESHSHAKDPDAWLQSNEVDALVNKTIAKAKESDEAGDLLESLNLYRALNLLFETPATYREGVKKAERRLRLIRMYAPDQLKELIRQRAKKMGKKDEPDVNLGDDTWEKMLEGVNRQIMINALAASAQRHIDRPGFVPLITGAIDAVIMLLDTPSISKTRGFEGLAKEGKVSRFREALKGLRQMLQRQRALSLRDADRILEQIMDANEATVQLPSRVLIFEMADGAMTSLDDFSNVIWPRETNQFNRNIEGRFYGVGIQISMRDGRLVVVSPLSGSPAYRAGIRAGDVIATVNKKSTDGWTLDKAVRTITGPKGTEVLLGVERKGVADLLEYPIKRDAIKIESIRGWEHDAKGGWDYLIDEKSRIGYVRLSQFIPQTADDLDAAVSDMIDNGGLNGLIIDLRFNPGGLLSSAIQVTDRFVEAGPIVSTVGPDGRKTREHRARRSNTYPDFPVVVLINQGSASASEILSGALKDYGRASIIGSRSFGKGSVQDLFDLRHRDARLKLTTQYYMLPNGGIIHRKPGAKLWGIEPTLKVEVPNEIVADAIELRQQVDVLHQDDEPAGDKPLPKADDILKKGLDPQLEAGLIVLKTKLLMKQLAAK